MGGRQAGRQILPKNHRPGVNGTFKPSIGLSHYPKKDYFF